MTAPWLYATRPVKSATSTITSRMRLIIPLFSGISGVDPNPHCLRMVVHGDQLRVALRPQSAEAGGDVELIAAARKQGLHHGERHLDVHLRPVMVLANLDQKVSAHFGDTHVLVTVLDRDELVVTGAANRVHENAKIDAVDIAPDFHLPALRSWAWMHGRTFSASDSGTLTRTFSPSRSVSSTLTCSQRSSPRAVATAAANVNTNSQQRRASKPATRPDSTLFMFVTSPLKTYCGNEKPLPEVPNIFNRGSGIWDLGSGLLQVG